MVMESGSTVRAGAFGLQPCIKNCPAFRIKDLRYETKI